MLISRLRLPMAHQTPVESKVTPESKASTASKVMRRLPIGAEVQPDANGGGVHFRVWAPDRKRVAVVIDGHATPLTPEDDGSEGGRGYFSGLIDHARRRHALQAETGRQRLSVPRHGVALPAGRAARAVAGRGSHALHVDRRQLGAAARSKARCSTRCTSAPSPRKARGAPRPIELEALRDIGITLLEIMPIAEFPGNFGWGYDGVDWFAPTRLYGEPDDAARVRGSSARARTRRDPRRRLQPPRPGRQLSGRVLEVDYFSDRYKNEWGDPLNFDGPDAHGVRELVLANVRTGSRSSTSTAIASTRRSRSSTRRTITSSAALSRVARKAAARSARR